MGKLDLEKSVLGVFDGELRSFSVKSKQKNGDKRFKLSYSYNFVWMTFKNKKRTQLLF